MYPHHDWPCVDRQVRPGPLQYQCARPVTAVQLTLQERAADMAGASGIWVSERTWLEDVELVTLRICHRHMVRRPI